MEQHNFVKEWMQYADQKSDLFFHFFCYFVAFNHLYDTKALLREPERKILDSKRTLSERAKILSFLRHTLIDDDGPNLNVIIDERWLETLENAKHRDEKTGAWTPLLTGDEYWVKKKSRDTRNPRWKVVLALLRVYIIRCNLFHGEKDPTDENDKKLVMVSNHVLESFLSVCLHRKLGGYQTTYSRPDNKLQ